MKILVTGGAGGIGKYVVETLVGAGHEVLVMDRMLPQRGVEGARYRLGDHENLGDIVALCPGMDAIAHLSAIPTGGISPDTDIVRTNVMGTYNVHEAAVIAGVPLVVSTSSMAVLGFPFQTHPFLPAYLPMDEQHPTLIQDAYGLSKRMGEEIAHMYHRRSGLRVCSIRPVLVVHPENYETTFKRTIEAARKWSSLMMAYIDVRDLATAFQAALEAPASIVQDEVFNIAADDSLALEPLADLLSQLDPALTDMARSLVGMQSMVSTEHVKHTLGWYPVHSWRDYVKL